MKYLLFILVLTFPILVSAQEVKYDIPLGGSCGTSFDHTHDCKEDLECDGTTLTCQKHPTSAATASGAATPGTTTAKPSAPPPTQTSQNTFVPLTNLPGVKDAGNASTLPNFLNSLYKLCIGAAAVIAVLQIMRAGVYFMFNKGSVAQNEQGKSLIQNSVLGLILVLSPAIVFGIINPDILKLKIDVSKLQPKEGGVTNNDLSTINQLQCSAYVNPTEYCDSSSTRNLTTQCNPEAKCPDGKINAPASCCSLVHSGAACCVQIPKDLYAIAFTYLRKNNDGTTCRVSYSHYYANLTGGAVTDPSGAAPSGCDANATKSFIEKQNGLVSGSLQMIKSCEKTEKAYTFPDNLRNTCAAEAPRSATSPITIRVLKAQGTGAFDGSNVWQGSATDYAAFANACHKQSGRVHGDINPTLVACGTDPQGCRNATLTCVKQ